MYGVVEWLKARLKKNRDVFCILIGAKGNGKSYTALRLAEVIGNQESILLERDLIYDPIVFLENILNERYQYGHGIVFDEIGVWHNSRDFYKETNKALNNVFQTVRPYRLAIFYTTPSMKFVDLGLRILADCVGWVKGVDEKNETTLVDFRIVEHNPLTGKTYYPRFRVGNASVNVLEVEKPSCWKEYEIYRNNISKKVLRESLNRMRGVIDLNLREDDVEAGFVRV